MSSIQSYRDLIVWQRAMKLVEAVYESTANFPRSELYGLTSQMRRSAVSVPANIAEEHARHSRGEYIQFLGVARGSQAELETHTELAFRFGWLSEVEQNALGEETDHIARMLTSLVAKLREK
jgi:four helix bundle protein